MKWLGGTNRESFERNFALDYERWSKAPRTRSKAPATWARCFPGGGRALRRAQGARGAGRRSHGPVGASVRGDAAYYQARSRFEAASTTLKAVRVSSQKWNAARRAYEDAAEEAQKATVAYRDIENERTRLERIKRVATTVQELRAAQAERAALGVPAPLPRPRPPR